MTRTAEAGLGTIYKVIGKPRRLMPDGVVSFGDLYRPMIPKGFDAGSKAGWFKKGQAPPPERRCAKIIRATREQCKRYKEPQSNYCRVHGGRRKHKRTITKKSKDVFYRSVLGPKLSAVLDQIKTDNGDQFDLTGELLLMKSTILPVIALYSIAMDKEDHTNAVKSGALMREVLVEISELADKAANIRAKSKNVLTPQDVQDVVNQITRMVERIFGQHKEEMRAFDKLLNEELRLPTMGTQGTSLTPDQTVLEMDSSIPYIPEEEPVGASAN